MMGIMGRIAGYTGKQVTWDQALNSKKSLSKIRIGKPANTPCLLRLFPADAIAPHVRHSRRLPKPH